jgi:hypothetical protein
MAVDRIHKNRKGFKHRHHGVWLMLRSCTRSALLLVAAGRCAALQGEGAGFGGSGGFLPAGWRGAVRGALEMLEYWRDEARDARGWWVVLRELVGDCDGEGMGMDEDEEGLLRC